MYVLDVDWYAKIFKEIQGYTTIYMDIQGDTRTYQDIEGYTRHDVHAYIYTKIRKDIHRPKLVGAFVWSYVGIAACCSTARHAMIQPLQRNWRWFHKQREQCAYWAFLEFLLPCLYLHSLKVSQLEKESQEQRERCKMLSAELENAYNLHRTSIYFFFKFIFTK